MAISHDGRRLVTSCWDDEMLRLWDAQTGKQLWDLKYGTVQLFAFSPDGKLLATGGVGDARVHLLETATGKELHEDRTFGYAWPAAIAFSPDSRRLATLAEDGFVHLYDIATGRSLARLPGTLRSNFDGNSLGGLAFSGDGKRLATSGDGVIHIWDLATNQELCPLDEHASRPGALAFSADGNMLASSFMDNTLCVWDLKTGKPIRRLRDGWYTHLQFSPGQFSALRETGNYPDTRMSWDRWELKTGKLVHEVPLSSGMQWLDHYRTRDESLVAFNDKEGVAHLVDGTGKERLRLVDRSVRSLSPDGRLLILQAKETCLWSTVENRMLCHFKAPQGWPGISADGRTAFAVSNPKARARSWELTLWESYTGQKRAWFDVGGPLAFSTDGRFLAAAAADRPEEVQIYDLASRKEICRFLGHHGAVEALAFSADGKRLASASDDTTVLLWDVSDLGRPQPVKRITEAELTAAWDRLAQLDGEKAYQAMWTLVGAPDQTVALCRERLRPMATDLASIRRLVEDLGADAFELRQRATAELEKAGHAAALELRRRQSRQPGLEVSRRIEDLLKKLTLPPVGDELRDLRAIEALELIGTTDARQVLERLAGGTPGAWQTEEAKASLLRLRGR